MHLDELATRLLEEGCNPAVYAIGTRGDASDAYCLLFVDAQWQVFYTERGLDQPPIFASANQSLACTFFFYLIMSLTHEHCVGFFRSERHAQDLMETLTDLGVHPHQDRIPYELKSPRFRVFVTCKEIFRVKAAFRTIPVHDY